VENVTEKMESTESKPTSRPVPKRQGDSSSGAFLAMVIALAAAGGSYYLWQQHLIAEKDRKVLQQSINELLGAVEQRDQAQQTRIGAMREHTHSALEQRLNRIEQSMPEVNRQVIIQQQEWGVAEVDYLLRTAEHQLGLNRDIPTAIAALTKARDQLQQQTMGEYAGVVAAIEQRIAELSRLDTFEQINNRLSALISVSESLPFAVKAGGETVESELPTPTDEQAGITGKAKQWGEMVWHDVKSLVTIRRAEDTELPIIEPQQIQLWRTQLAIKLESARLAALQHNAALYQTALSEAKGVVVRYFDGEDDGVKGAMATLDGLAAIELDNAFPSLAGLRQQLHETQQREVPVEPFVPEGEAFPLPDELTPESNPWGIRP